MHRQEIIARLRKNELALRDRRVRHAALFGSPARGDQRLDSDVDFMIEVDPAATKDYIAGLLTSASMSSGA